MIGSVHDYYMFSKKKKSYNVIMNQVVTSTRVRIRVLQLALCSYYVSSPRNSNLLISICNKPFKPLGIPSGRVKSREGLTEMLPTNILHGHIITKNKASQK
jgi:hypothetical protein